MKIMLKGVRNKIPGGVLIETSANSVTTDFERMVRCLQKEYNLRVTTVGEYLCDVCRLDGTHIGILVVEV